MAFLFLYMINRLNGRSLSNNARRERLLKKAEMTWYILQNYQGVGARSRVLVVEVSGGLFNL